jgi:hypothetical protein
VLNIKTPRAAKRYKRFVAFSGGEMVGATLPNTQLAAIK